MLYIQNRTTTFLYGLHRSPILSIGGQIKLLGKVRLKDLLEIFLEYGK